MGACVASLLELPIEAVPCDDFLRQPGDRPFDWASRLDDFLAQFGLYALHFSAKGLATFPGCLHVITGFSARGRPHACVGRGRHVVWDPHPDQTGLMGPPDGFIVLAARLE